MAAKPTDETAEPQLGSPAADRARPAGFGAIGPMSETWPKQSAAFLALAHAKLLTNCRYVASIGTRQR